MFHRWRATEGANCGTVVTVWVFAIVPQSLLLRSAPHAQPLAENGGKGGSKPLTQDIASKGLFQGWEY